MKAVLMIKLPGLLAEREQKFQPALGSTVQPDEFEGRILHDVLAVKSQWRCCLGQQQTGSPMGVFNPRQKPIDSC